MSEFYSNNEKMEKQILEIVSAIIDGLSEDMTPDQVEAKIKKSKYYRESTVATAYSWIYDKLLANALRTRAMPVSKGKRFFSQDEIEIVGNENYKKLLKLVNIGFLDEDDLDLIMNKLFIFPDETVTKQELNIIVLSSLFDVDKNTLPGSRTLLFLSDTIN